MSWVFFTMGYCNFTVTLTIMNISTMLSTSLNELKVINEVIKLLNDIEVHTHVHILSSYIRTIYMASLAFLNNEYPVSSPGNWSM